MEKLPFSIRLAEKVIKGIGTWKFLIIQTIVLITWAIVNLAGFVKLDPWPFIAMNLLLSLQAAYTAPILLMAERRHAEHDREIADKDLKTDREAFKMITSIDQRLDRLEKVFTEVLKAARERNQRSR